MLGRFAPVALPPYWGKLRAPPRDPAARKPVRTNRRRGAMGFYKKEITANVRLDVRVNPQEKAEIKERAERACLTVSDYVRRCALSKRVDMRYDVDAILAITSARDRISELLKLPQSQVTPAEAKFAFEEVMAAIRRV